MPDGDRCSLAERNVRLLDARKLSLSPNKYPNSARAELQVGGISSVAHGTDKSRRIHAGPRGVKKSSLPPSLPHPELRNWPRNKIPSCNFPLPPSPCLTARSVRAEKSMPRFMPRQRDYSRGRRAGGRVPATDNLSLPPAGVVFRTMFPGGHTSRRVPTIPEHVAPRREGERGQGGGGRRTARKFRRDSGFGGGGGEEKPRLSILHIPR